MKNWFKFYKNFKSKKSRLKAVELALKTNCDFTKITKVADDINKYINTGL